NRNLVFGSSSGYAALTLGNVHIPRLATDEGFINFNVSRKFHKGSLLHGFTNTMKHEPCRLLSDTDIAGDFTTTDPVLAIGNQPDGSHPLMHSKGAILEDCPDLHGELLFAVLAEPEATSRNE